MSEAGSARTPSQAYADGVAAGRWRDDPAQHPALRELVARLDLDPAS